MAKNSCTIVLIKNSGNTVVLKQEWNFCTTCKLFDFNFVHKRNGRGRKLGNLRKNQEVFYF
jgi:predicted double-glycine peptidase